MTVITNRVMQSAAGIQDEKSEKERVTLRLPPQLLVRLAELQEITHAATVTEVLRNALLFYDALVRERLAGNDVYVISKDGEKTKYPVFLS